MLAWLSYPTYTLFKDANPLETYAPQPYNFTVSFPIYLNNQSFGQYDFNVGLTLKYNGTLVPKTPVTVIARAGEHTATSYMINLIVIRFQDSLSYPSYVVDNQGIPTQAGIQLKLTGDKLMTGTNTIYFPLEGSFSATYQVNLYNATSGATTIIGPRPIPEVTVQVQHPDTIRNEKVADETLRLTFGLYVLALIGLFAAVVGAFYEASKYARDN